jgi:hypothetical protein
MGPGSREIPAITTLAILAFARFTYPNPEHLATHPADVRTTGLPHEMWTYLIATMLVAAGFADFSLMAFHFAQAGTLAPDIVPVFYAAAMGVAGLGSLLLEPHSPAAGS